MIPLKHGAVPVSMSGMSNKEMLNELRIQNNILMTLINTTEKGLRIDGQSFNLRAARVADNIFMERSNREVDPQASLLI